MGRAPCCSKVGLHRGPWTGREDALLANYIQCHGEGNWRSLPKKAGLLRCGKSCRLRWMNYLRPDIKRGNIGPEEEDLIIRLHSLLGNRWSIIAGRLPGRTDNEIKNYWNSHLSKKLKRQGVELQGTTKPCTSKRSSNSKSSSRTTTKNKDKRSKNKNRLPIIQEEERENTLKTKIHAPKPTRLTVAMRNSSNATTETTQGSDQNVESNLSEDEIGDMSCPEVDNINEGSLFVDSGHMHGYQSFYGTDCDFQCELHDRVYQDYSQLLISDQEDQFPLFSSTESLLLW